MICNKAAICGIDCIDKYPHEEEIACIVECDWHGKCIPFKLDTHEDDFLDNDDCLTEDN